MLLRRGLIMPNSVAGWTRAQLRRFIVLVSGEGAAAQKVDDLTDASTNAAHSTTPTGGQALVWSSAHSRWQPTTVGDLDPVSVFNGKAVDRLITVTGNAPHSELQGEANLTFDDATLVVGANGTNTGKDVRFWGDTTNKSLFWDSSDEKLLITGVGGTISLDVTAGNVNIADGLSVGGTLTLDGTAVTATAAELNKMQGVTATAAELNIVDGISATAGELNIMDGVTASTAELNIMDGVTASTVELNIIDGVTASTAELNIMDGVTATAAELNIMDGVTATAAEINYLDDDNLTGADLTKLAALTATAAEINYLDNDNLTAADLTKLAALTATAAEINYLDDDNLTAADLTKLAALTATAAEINYLDDDNLTAADLTKLAAVDATAAQLNYLNNGSLTAADLTKLAALDATATELNVLDGDTTPGAVTVVDGDGVIINDVNDVMKQCTVQSLAAYFDDEITAMPNLTTAGSLVTVGALGGGSIAAGFGAIDNGTSNITTGGILKVDVDGSAINAAGSLTMGASDVAAIYFDGTDLRVDTAASADISFRQNGTEIASLDETGLDLASGDIYKIAGTSVLSATALGSGVLASSLTSLGTIGSLVATTADINGGSIDGVTIGTASACTNLVVDDIAIDGKVITMTGSTGDTATMTVGTNGTLAITTTDAGDSSANMTLTADGTFEAVGTTITLDSGGAINLEPAVGSAIVLDGTINVDAGVVTDATSITSVAFTGTGTSGFANVNVTSDLDVDGITSLDNTSIVGTFGMAGTGFDVNATADCTIDNSNINEASSDYGVRIGLGTTNGFVFIGNATTTTKIYGQTLWMESLTVDKNLIVNGEYIYQNVATVTIEDPLIKLASGNNLDDDVDIGFYGLCDPTTSQDTYTGLFRDADDEQWHLFHRLQTEPTTEIDKTATGFDHANLTVGALTADDLSTFSAGATFGDADITNVDTIHCNSVVVDDAAVGLDIVFGGATTTNKISLTNNIADALNITQASNSYIKFVTTTGSEKIVISKSIDADISTFSAVCSSTAEITVADGSALTLGNAEKNAYFKVVGDSDVADELVSVKNTEGTSEAAIAITSTAGGVDINANAAKDITLDGGQIKATAAHNEADAIKLHATAGALQTIVLVNDEGTNEAAVAITSTLGGVDINANAAKDVTIDGGQIKATAAHDTPEAIKLHASTGATQTIVVENAAGTNEAAIAITSTAGGIDINANAAKDVTIDGGQIKATAAHNTPEAIKLHASTGATQTIVLLNEAGTDEAAVAITSTAGGVDINANAAKDVTIDGGQIKATAAHDIADSIKLHASAGTNQTIVLLNEEGTADGAVAVQSKVGGILLNVDAADKKIHLDSEGSVDIDAVTGLSIDCTGPANLTVTADATGEDLTIAQGGSVDASVHISSAGTADDALTIKTSAGGIDIQVAGAAADEDLDISSNTSVNITASEAVDDAIVLNASAGGVDIDAAATKDVTINSGQIIATAAHNVADSIKLHADAGANQTIVLLNDEGTTDGADESGVPEGAIVLNSAAGGIGIGWADGKDLWAEGGRAIVTANENASEAIKLHADAGANQTIVLLNDEGTSEAAVAITSTAGGVAINANASKDITLDGGQMVTTATHNSTEAIKLHADAGTSQTIVLLNDEGTSESAVALTSTAGGIAVNANAAKDITFDGGQVVATAAHNVASAIKLHADAGASQTIVVVNDEGTDDKAIEILASAGGVSIECANEKEVYIGNPAKDAYVTVAASATPSSEDIRVINTAGTDAKAIEILASAGGVSIECANGKEVYIGNPAKDAYVTVAASGTPANEDVRIINTAGTDAKAIEILASGGGVSIECSNEKEVYIGNPAKDAYVTVAASGTPANEDIRIVNTAGTDAKAIEILATAGGVSIECANEKEVYIGNNDKDAYVTVAASSTPGSEDIRIVNTNGTDAAAVEVTATAGGILLNVDSVTKKIHLDSEGFVDIDSPIEIKSTAPLVTDVHDFNTTAPFSLQAFDGDGDGGGKIIKFEPGSESTLTLGGLYFLHTDGTWDAVNADNPATGASQLLGIAMGTSARSDGMLLNGFVRIPSTQIEALSAGSCEGKPLYVSEAAGRFDFNPPDAFTYFVRVVGYALEDNGSDVLVYFNPDPTWVEIS
jgi:hypothetical protein